MLAAGGLGLADWADRHLGGSVFLQGPLDETAHLLTALLVLWAIGRRASERFALGALLGSVLIDLDHIPDELGMAWLTKGTPRPYTHSLLTIAALLIAARLWRGRRVPLLGCALGVSVHFVRDLAEPRAGVPLLWPWSSRSFTIPHGAYVALVGLLIAVALMRCRMIES